MGPARTAVGAAVAVVTGAAVVAVTGFILSTAGAEANSLSATVKGTAQTSQGLLPHAFLHLDTYPDSEQGVHGKDGGAHPDWVTYGPSSQLRVPAHSLVTVTIDQYDTGDVITNPYFASVRGTVGGTEIVNGKTVTKIDANSVGHTFTLHAAPTNQDPLFVSVPLPALPDSAVPVGNAEYPKPNVVTFSFITGGRGDYVWNCEFPCGDAYYASFGGPMSTRGYMSGSLTVT
jgi:hypothetical protein